MHLSFVSALLVLGGSVSASVTPRAAPALPVPDYAKIKALPLDEILNGGNRNKIFAEPQAEPGFSIAATCANVQTRVEWDNLSASDRTAFLDAIVCLQGRRPSGRYAQARSRYEDFVAVHQNLTPNVHGNSKFLVWHRYFLWAFEKALRDECGFNRPFPWFDETRYAGRFSQSSIFSGQYLGAIGLGGRCVTDGRFANLQCNIGPGSSNVPHCLNRDGQASITAGTSAAVVNGCNARGSYSDMAGCSEGGAHANGHNGIGAVMSDMFSSPSDPVFWLHHAFIDRNFRIWQNADSNRVRSINGNDRFGTPLTLDTSINIQGLQPDVRIRDILDTTETTLCYRYNY